MSLRDKLRFACEPLCMGVQADADSFVRKVKATVDVPEAQQEDLNSFAVIYCATQDIVFAFDGKEKRALLEFRDTWNKRDAMTPAALWGWRQHLPYAVFNLWAEDYIRDQDLYEVDPAQLPFDKLTDEQRKELANPDSPLASNATNIPAA